MYGPDYVPEPKELKDSSSEENSAEEDEEDMEAKILRLLG